MFRRRPAGVLLMIGAVGGHWFITPHPDATTIVTAFTALQVLVGIGGAVYLALRERRLPISGAA